uniref:Periviscerokinin-1 n=1 Tax=Sarcophaga bullata TaxID=7385 RepID=PVK1_SARBU|nr:RecName: Full=Periviscerokinin-1; AltName: Full=Neobu-PVK-1 [Sarcophaga bullata]
NGGTSGLFAFPRV